MRTWARRTATSRTAAVVLTASTVLLTAAGCPKGTTSGARTAIEGMQQIVQQGDTSIDDLLRHQRALDDIPAEQFSESDLALRNRLLQQGDDLLARGVVRTVDDAVRTQLAAVPQQAEQVAESAAVGTSDQPFLRDFAEVTEDVVVGAACEEVLNVIAPDQKPDEPGEGSAWEDAAQEAHDKLVARTWRSETFVNLVDWAYYATTVLEHGQQFKDAVAADPTEYVQFASVPPVQRAVVVYLRTCYTPPRPFGPAR